MHHFRVICYLNNLRSHRRLRLYICNRLGNRIGYHLLHVCHCKRRFCLIACFRVNFNGFTRQFRRNFSQRNFASVVSDSGHIICIDRQDIFFARFCLFSSIRGLIFLRNIKENIFFLDFLRHRRFLRSSGFLSSVLVFSHVAHSFQI